MLYLSQCILGLWLLPVSLMILLPLALLVGWGISRGIHILFAAPEPHGKECTPLA